MSITHLTYVVTATESTLHPRSTGRIVYAKWYRSIPECRLYTRRAMLYFGLCIFGTDLWPPLYRSEPLLLMLAIEMSIDVI